VTVEIKRGITEDELVAAITPISAAFGEGATPEQIEDSKLLTELDRFLLAYDGGDIVGTASEFSFELTLPGGATIPIGGVSDVAVAATHRRRGILRQLMARQLDAIAERGEPVALLTASESSIYGRFGYGLATSTASIRIETDHAAFQREPEAGGRLRMVFGDEARKVVPEAYERYRRARAGSLTRSDRYWELLFRDRQKDRGGASARFDVVHQDAGGRADGFVTYRIANEWPDSIARNECRVIELLAADAEVEAALWRFVLDLDLVGEVSARDVAVDAPLRWRLADPRRLRFVRQRDWLWARLLDVPAALSARSFGPGEPVVIEVVDAFRPQTAGQYRDGPDGCERVSDAADADVRCDVADLGAAYLGGVSFGTLARAGRVDELRAGATAAADALFATDVAPFCTTMF
jgi:predicted acetyltransferase